MPIRSIAACLCGAAVALILLNTFQSATATRIQWCMRVVPSGEIVTRYGENSCKR